MLDLLVVLGQVFCAVALVCGLVLSFVHRAEAAQTVTDFDPMPSGTAGFRMRIVKEDAGVAELRKLAPEISPHRLSAAPSPQVPAQAQ